MARGVLVAVGFVVAVSLLATSCSSGSSLGVELDDREFWSTEVIEAGAPRPLVENTRLTLRFFPDDRLSIGTGCNSIGGTYQIDGDRLVLRDGGMTQMGCDPERHAQETFVERFVSAEPSVAVDGTDLELRSGDVVMRFVDATVANPDRTLEDTTWQVDGFDDGQVATSFNVERPAQFSLGRGSISGFDGCADFNAAVKIGPATLQIFTTSPDGFPPPFSDEECDPVEYVAMVRQVLGGDSSYEITGDRLRVERDGVALTARAID